MRHAAASAQLGPNVDIPIIQEVLGHADVRTTRSHQNVGVELTRQAATAMEAGPYGPSQPLPTPGIWRLPQMVPNATDSDEDVAS